MAILVMLVVARTVIIMVVVVMIAVTANCEVTAIMMIVGPPARWNPVSHHLTKQTMEY